LRSVAKHADHWNVWGGPKVLARKTAILEEHSSAVGRDSKSIARSVNMILQFTDNRSDVDRLSETITKRLGSSPEDAQDICLAGSVDHVRERITELKAAGATTLFIPTMFRPLDELRRDMDRLAQEVVPAFR
jgi:alkanesulfonate monooxygenase SsuD/methylene tetrahydromethanopterin reductase-like flavin-dependent oxidoreductase (luciferase family)